MSRFRSPPLTSLANDDEALGRVRAAIEHHVLHAFEQIGRNILVDGQLPGIDDAHVEAGLDRVEQEDGVHCLADDVVAAEGEREVADAAAHLRARARSLDGPGGLDERHRVGRVLLEASRHGQHVRVEDDVCRIEAGAFDEQPVGALTDRDSPLERVGLTPFVERHDDDRRAVAAHELRAFARKSASPSLSEIELTTGFPCTHLSPASMTDQRELSIITGTRAISGSVAM